MDPDQGPRVPRREAVSPGRRGHAGRVLGGPCGLHQRPGQPLRRLRVIRAAPAGRLRRSPPRAVYELSDPLRGRLRVHRAWHAGLDPQGAGRGRDGGRGLPRALRRHRHPPGRDRGDGGAARLRAAGRGGRSALTDRAPAARLASGRRGLHPGLHAGLADSVARHAADPALVCPQGCGPGGGGITQRAAPIRTPTRSWRPSSGSCAANSGPRRIRRPARPSMPSPSPSWWAGWSGSPTTRR